MVINSSTDVQMHWYGESGMPLAVLMHDYMGRLDWIDALARRFADAGYRVAVPDFYSGRSTTEHDDAVSLMQQCMADVPAAFRQVQEAIGEARALGSEQVALIGFSMGTRLALAYAAEHPGVDAVVGYYGRPFDPTAHVRVPVLFQLGHDDVDADGSAEAFTLQSTMREQGFDGIQVEVFEDARHGFQNEQNPAKHSAAASEAAFARTLEFLRAHLG